MNFGDFCRAYEPNVTARKYLAYLFGPALPSAAEARYLSERWDSITEFDYDILKEALGQDAADAERLFRNLTPFGWYLILWIKWFLSFNPSDFEDWKMCSTIYAYELEEERHAVLIHNSVEDIDLLAHEY